MSYVKDPRVDAYLDGLPDRQRFHEGDPIDEPALLAMFREIIAIDRAGGWRAIKAGQASGTAATP